jgi:hypothetical protein
LAHTVVIVQSVADGVRVVGEHRSIKFLPP